jgi:hypothetical protein
VAEEDSDDELFKDCPFCGEQIRAVAKKCKHCGEFLDRRRVVTTARSGAQGGEPPPKLTFGKWILDRLALLAVALIFAIAAIILIWMNSGAR